MYSKINRFVRKVINQAYYKGRESLLGHHKRDIVVVHVDQACESLEDSREQFEDALEKFKTILTLPELSLEYRYQQLKKQYEFCRLKTDEVSYRIRAIEEVADALFDEWEQELELYSNRSLRARSRQQLEKSRRQYQKLIKMMKKAEARIYPVLNTFHDQVLFLKHNLNAQAIAALQQEFAVISLDISKLIAIMEKTIAEASQFVLLLTDQKQLTGPEK
jgi:glycerol-3-phosphate cytidylyltransferase-like family protein